MQIEMIYKCRDCGCKFSIINENYNREDGFTADGHFRTDNIASEIFTQKCKNCCMHCTNGAQIYVVADLIRFIIL